MEILVIGVVRVVGSVWVLRWALVGALMAIAIDLSDLFLKNLLDLGGLKDYQRFDKIADLVYMACFLIVSRRWSGPAKSVAAWLFGFRMIGLVVFEFTEARWVLLLFANVFEFWFVANAAILHWRPNKVLSARAAGTLLVAMTPLKLLQEYVLHYGQWLDDFTAIEAVEAIWEWVAFL